MRPLKSRNPIKLRWLMPFLCLLAMAAAFAFLPGRSNHEVGEASTQPLSPWTQAALVTSWTIYVLAVFFRRPHASNGN